MKKPRYNCCYSGISGLFLSGKVGKPEGWVVSAPPGFFLFWVRFWVRATEPHQDLRRINKEKAAPWGERLRAVRKHGRRGPEESRSTRLLGPGILSRVQARSGKSRRSTSAGPRRPACRLRDGDRAGTSLGGAALRVGWQRFKKAMGGRLAGFQHGSLEKEPL